MTRASAKTTGRYTRMCSTRRGRWRGLCVGLGAFSDEGQERSKREYARVVLSAWIRCRLPVQMNAGTASGGTFETEIENATANEAGTSSNAHTAPSPARPSPTRFTALEKQAASPRPATAEAPTPVSDVLAQTHAVLTPAPADAI
ncbi:hypothetical protein MSAN_02262500 [Mycena sanguinolenta]|uniref:Uncharacterized protein n=1 Tax=Mycena sanguinolenta TaxID=230812 RepID=A0A8H6X9W9_9AGAR|nr:hypothetical protein MSAN_02262500 [Mycena sanguinolenta]